MKMKKLPTLLLALCLAFILTPDLNLPTLSPAAEAASSTVGDDPSTLAPGDYTIRYTVGRNGPDPDYDRMRIRVWAGSTLLGSVENAKTLPLWDEKTAFLTLDQVPDRIEFQIRYTTDGQNWREYAYESAFEECYDADAWVGSGDSEILLCYYTIHEDVPRLIDLNGNERKIRGAQPLSGSATELTSGWYWAKANFETTKRVRINGNVNIIVDENVILYYTRGIRLTAGNALTVWTRKVDTGTIYCDASAIDSCAGIGGNEDEDAGAFTLNGGAVHVLGGLGAAGLGGGEQGLGGMVTVNRGFLEARTTTGSEDGDGAGIGGGEDRSGGSVTINGGEVYAVGGNRGAGIGGGEGGHQGGAITINGGKVYAEGNRGAGIGGGKDERGGGDGGLVTINGGEVTAYSFLAAGIGGGNGGTNGRIVINGGKVNSESKSYGAGIGAGGSCSQGDEIVINGGDVKAKSRYGAGIGGSSDQGDCAAYDGGVVTITGGKVDAYSETGAGIGGGGGDWISTEEGDGGTVRVSGGLVMAASGQKGAGIGGGNDGNGGTVIVSGGMVIATGGYLDYSFLRENGHCSNTVKKGMRGTSVIGGTAQTMIDNDIYDKIADCVLEWIFSGEFGGAGIGGGDEGNGGTVIVTGGTVIANAGMNTAHAIGRGNDGGSDGRLEIYNTAMVNVGMIEHELHSVPSADRVSAAQDFRYAEVTPCDHSENAMEYIDWETHLLSCACCVGNDEGVPVFHEFDPMTHVCPCGQCEYPLLVRTTGEGSAAAAPYQYGSIAETPAYAPAGAPLRLIVTPDEADAIISVTAVYTDDEGNHELTGGVLQPEEGLALFSDYVMPAAPLTIEVVFEQPEPEVPTVVFTENADTYIDGVPVYFYDGRYHAPEVSVFYGGEKLVEDQDYYLGFTDWDHNNSFNPTADMIRAASYSVFVYGAYDTPFEELIDARRNFRIANQPDNQYVFYANDGTERFVLSGPLNWGQVPTDEQIPTFTRPLYRQTRWYTAPSCAEGTEFDISVPATGAVFTSSRIALYAGWAPLTVTLLSNTGVQNLRYDVLDDGALAASAETAHPGQFFTEDEVLYFILPEVELTAPAGRLYDGWELEGTVYHSGETVPVSCDTVLTIAWKSCWDELQNIIDGAEDGAVISLDWECIADPDAAALSIPAGKAITLDLNGHTISRSLTSTMSGGNVFTVEGTLTITDSAGGGAISGGWNSGSGGAIVNSGTLTISGGTVTGSRAPEGGAIQNNASGILNLDGGCLTGNQATSYGGAILNRGIINMSGGTISGNTSRLNGAGIWTSGTVNLSGGTITGNTAGNGQNGAGLYFSAGTVNLSGAPVVWENTPNDLYLRSPMVITAAGALTSGLHIGIASEVWPAENQPLTVVTGITAYAGGIVCHKPMYPSVVYPDGALRMIVRPTFGVPDLTLPDGLVSIEANAFEGAELVTVVDAHNCTAIGPEAFKGCTGLTQILLPADCRIDSTAFDGCDGPVFVFAPAGGDTEASCEAILHCAFIGA